MADQPGIFRGLFDFRLDHFITRRALGIVYTLWATIWTLAAGAGMLGAVAVTADGEPFGPALFVAIPVAWFAVLLISRIYVELIVVLFRIADHTRATAEMVSATSAAYRDDAGRYEFDDEGWVDEPAEHLPGGSEPADEP